MRIEPLNPGDVQSIEKGMRFMLFGFSFFGIILLGIWYFVYYKQGLLWQQGGGVLFVCAVLSFVFGMYFWKRGKKDLQVMQKNVYEVVVLEKKEAYRQKSGELYYTLKLEELNNMMISEKKVQNIAVGDRVHVEKTQSGKLLAFKKIEE